MPKTTTHERAAFAAHGHSFAAQTITLEGENLYDVTVLVDDGQTTTIRVAANDEWQARTRTMVVQDSLDLHGQHVEYEVVLADETVVAPSEIIGAAKAAGFTITAETVAEFARSGSVPESTIGEEYDEALSDTLQGIFDELGIEVGQ